MKKNSKESKRAKPPEEEMRRPEAKRLQECWECGRPRVKVQVRGCQKRSELRAR